MKPYHDLIIEVGYGTRVNAGGSDFARLGVCASLDGNIARRTDDFGVAGGGAGLAKAKASAEPVNGKAEASFVGSGILRNIGATLPLAAGALKIPCVVVSSFHDRTAN
jgi:hypothetical protein